MLVLVLDHHAVDVGVAEKLVLRHELDPVQDVEGLVPDPGDVGAGLAGAEERQADTLGTGVAEGVVDVVEAPGSGTQPRHRFQQPQLLVVADVGEVPHER